MTKIAILSRYQNKISRGAESFVYELTKRLSKKYQVEVLSGQDADSFSKITLGKYDVLFSLNGRSQSFKASIGRLFSPYKLVITGQSGIGRDDLWNIVVAKPNVFVALTERGYIWAKKYSWGSAVSKIPNGVDTSKFTPKGAKIELSLPRPIILSVGALTWYKYHERAIKAVAKLGYGSLLIVGKGEKQQELKELGRGLLHENFKILDFPYDLMPEVYRSANLFTLPSWDREAFGIVYLEAMASNLPVVAQDDLSRREIVGEGGMLVDVSNIDAYAKSLDNALKLKWENKPRNQAKKFSWNIIIKKYEKLIEGLTK